MKATQANAFRAPFIVGVLFSLLLQSSAVLGADPISGRTVDILWRAPGRQSIAIQKELAFDGSVMPEGASQSDVRSPALIYVLVGIVSIDLLVKTLMSAYKEVRYGGIVVRRGADGRLQIENDKRLAGGTILVDQGKAKEVRIFRASDKPGSGELLEAITPLLR
jgi:hypothetical protein